MFGPPAATTVIIAERMAQMQQPVGMRDAIIIGVGKDRARGELCAEISCDAETGVLLTMVKHALKLLGNLRGGIAGAIVDHHDLEIGIIQHQQ
jgi:hypothetical protein